MSRRKISVFGQPWEWQYRGGLAWDPEGRCHHLDLDKYFGYGNVQEHYFALTPKKVLYAISRQFLGFDDRAGFPPGVIPDDFKVARKPGYELLSGPRGQWQIKVERWMIQLISPEGFDYRADAGTIFGEDWNNEMRDEISRIYHQIKDQKNPDTRDERDAAWEQTLKEAQTPKIPYHHARRYLRERFGHYEGAA